MTSELSRRQLLACAGMGFGAGLAAGNVASAPAETSSPPKPGEPFRYCLNMATIMGQKLNPAEEADVAAKAGYSGIEPWVRNLRAYVEAGHTASELRKRIADLGLTVEGAIGFPSWAADDEARRAKGLDELKRDMELVAQVGGRRIAAPPAGINQTPDVDLRKVAERYHTVLEVGRQVGVLPQLEIWGSALTLGRAGEAALVAIQADHPDACLLLDMFHLYKGGSGFEGLKLLNGATALHVFHINDYPASPPREEIKDEHRVYPGDGVGPVDRVLRTLWATGFRGVLSLELFNREYWKQDPLQVARTGLEKIRAVVAKAMS